METVDTAAAVFALLGLPDDKGDATSSPFSARSVWKMCERAHRDYFSFDPQMVAAATEAVIYGTIANFLRYQWGPCCDGKNASAEMQSIDCTSHMLQPPHDLTAGADRGKATETGAHLPCRWSDSCCVPPATHPPNTHFTRFRS
jgi:hypothetical protein